MLRILYAMVMIFLSGCYYTPVPYHHGDQHPPVVPNRNYSVYTVRPDDTMYSISKSFGISYRLLARRNHIDYPYTIYVGQELYLNRTAPLTKSMPTFPQKSARLNYMSREHIDVSPPDRGFAKVHLVWPVNGKITGFFGEHNHRTNDGIDIAAPRGTPIHAVAAGTVVYSDNRLEGYGKLIIIRHAGDLFTAYAHNQRNLVLRGDKVKQGEIIARVGQTGRVAGPHLHFEVRRGPTPVNPLAYLPKR